MEDHGTATISPGQQAEIASRLVRAIPKAIAYSGLPTKGIIKFTAPGESLERALAEAFKMLYNGHANVVVPNWDVEPYVPAGWTLLSHAKNGSWRWDQNKVETWWSPKEATVEKMLKGLAGKPVLNAKFAEFLASPDYTVPYEWLGRYVVFPGTVFRNNEGESCVKGLLFRRDGSRSPVTLKFSEKWPTEWQVALLRTI